MYHTALFLKFTDFLGDNTGLYCIYSRPVLFSATVIVIDGDCIGFLIGNIEQREEYIDFAAMTVLGYNINRIII